MTDDHSAATAAELDEIEAGLLEFGYSQTNNRKAYAALRALRKQLAAAQKQARMLQVAYDGIGSLLLDLQIDCIAAVQASAKKDAALLIARAEIITLAEKGTERIRELGGSCDDAARTYELAVAKIDAALNASQEAPASPAADDQIAWDALAQAAQTPPPYAPASPSADEVLYGPATRTAPSLFAPASQEAPRLKAYADFRRSWGRAGGEPGVEKIGEGVDAHGRPYADYKLTASPSPGLNIDRTIPVPECLDEAMAAAGLPTSKDNAPGLREAVMVPREAIEALADFYQAFGWADKGESGGFRDDYVICSATYGKKLTLGMIRAAIRALSRPVSEREDGQ